MRAEQRQYGGCLDDKCASGLVGWLAKFRCVMLINKPVSCRPVWAARSTAAAAAAEGVLLTCALRLARAGTGGSRPPHLGTRYVTGNLDPRLWPDIGPNTGECITCVGRRCHPSPRRCVNNEPSGGMLFPSLSVRSVSKPHSYPQQFFTPYIAYRISSALHWCIRGGQTLNIDSRAYENSVWSRLDHPLARSCVKFSFKYIVALRFCAVLPTSYKTGDCLATKNV